MATVTYPTTKAGWHDTKFIAKQKWLQQKKSPSTASAGINTTFPTTDPQWNDTKLMVIQKILQKLQ